MRTIIIALAALLLFGGQTANASEWRHFGRDKAYASRDQAIADMPRVLRQRGYPEAVIAKFVEATKHPGKATHVNNGDILDFMRSGPKALWRDVHVNFDRPPADHMDYSARSEEWSVSWGGKTYTVGIPGICNNLYARPVSAVRKRALESSCATISFNASVDGHARWGIGSAQGPLPPSACNAQRQGNGAWQAWWGECDSCVPPIEYIRSILGEGAEVYQRFYYPATSTRQTIRFSAAVRDMVVYICKEEPTGEQTCGVYMRPEDWKGRRDVVIDDTLWRPDNGDCPE